MLFALLLAALALPALVLVRRVPALGAAGRGGAWLLGAVFSLGVVSVAALGSALAGVFSVPLVAALGAAAAGALALALPRSPAPPRGEGEGRPRRRRAALGAVALLALAYGKSYEHYLGGWDPGIYLATGASIARTGAVAVRDESFAALTPAERDLFTHERRGLRMKFPGFVIRDGASGALQPYFSHLYPVWIALLDGALGPTGGLWAGPVAVALAVAAAGLLGALLFSEAAGWAAAALLGLCVPVVWQARFPTAEPVALLFSLGGWAAAVLFLREGGRTLAALAGFLFACAVLAKVTTALPALLLLGVCVALAGASPAPGRAALPLALGAGVAAALPYYATAAREYAAAVFRGVLDRRFGGEVWAGALLAAAALAAAPALGRLARRQPAPARAAAGALLAGLAVYGYALRPVLERSTDAANLRELGWFVTPLFLALALAGALAVLARPAPGRRGEAQLAFLAAAAAAAAVVLHRKQVAPFYLWALRRYVPELLPALALFAAAAVAALRGHGRRPGRAAAATLLVAAVVAGGLARGRHLLRHREYEGAYRAIGEVAARIDRGAVTVCFDGWLATPLQFLFGRPSLAVSDATPEKSAAVADALAAWARRGEAVMLAVDGGDFFTARFGLVPAARVPFDLPVLERTARGYPRAIERFRPDVHLFRVVAAPGPGTHRPRAIAVALAPFGLGPGFHAPERTEQDGRERLFRWTGAEAVLEIPPPERPGEPWELTLSLGSGRPPGAGPVRVEVRLEGRHLGDLAVAGPLGDYRVRVPAGFPHPPGAGSLRLALLPETFVPAEGAGADRRVLGVMVEAVRL